MEYTIQALANLAGVTARTLRWYDEQGLLKPARVTAAGYRIYGPAQVDRLQSILFYRELGLELAAIRALLDAPDYDRQTMLRQHLQQLTARRSRLDGLIDTVRRTLDETQGGTKMTDKQKFEAFKKQQVADNEAAYGAEARQKYGSEKVDAANAKLMGMTEEEYAAFDALGKAINTALAAAVTAGEAPTGAEGQRIAAMHRRWLGYTWNFYTPQAHAGLAEGYVADERFTAYYDKEVSGCAVFLRDAIRAYTAAL